MQPFIKLVNFEWSNPIEGNRVTWCYHQLCLWSFGRTFSLQGSPFRAIQMGHCAPVLGPLTAIDIHVFVRIYHWDKLGLIIHVNIPNLMMKANIDSDHTCQNHLRNKWEKSQYELNGLSALGSIASTLLMMSLQVKWMFNFMPWFCLDDYFVKGHCRRVKQLLDRFWIVGLQPRSNLQVPSAFRIWGLTFDIKSYHCYSLLILISFMASGLPVAMKNYADDSPYWRAWQMKVSYTCCNQIVL